MVLLFWYLVLVLLMNLYGWQQTRKIDAWARAIQMQQHALRGLMGKQDMEPCP